MADNVQYLDDDEIKAFLDELDKNNDGIIDYGEVEHRLDLVHDELVPNPQAHHRLHHDSDEDQARHRLLRSIIGSDRDRIPRDEFAERVKAWKIPSMKQDKEAEQKENSYVKSLSVWRRVRAYWAVHGPEILFVALVVAMQLAFGIWQLVKYLTGEQYQAALGWGVVLAKTCAGALYPTLFFLLLSMSRYFATFMRRSYHISRFINWDLSQEFHIRISIVALILATLHAVGHLSGSFVSGSRPENQPAVAALIGEDMVPRPYVDYVRSLPGYTGLIALGLFCLVSLMSIPQVRRWNYEVFQLFHLLMFPIIGLLAAHGTLALFQWPMLGYFLAFPALLVIVERTVRVLLGFHRIPATLEILDSETVSIKATIPSKRLWQYQAGQYVFLQVPQLSRFQWHPFTVSACVGNDMVLHIKTDGDWTSKLRGLGQQPGRGGPTPLGIGINGPFGAPAQRFYDFSHAVVVGAGIGVTPFSGILADLQARDDRERGGPGHFGAVVEDAEKHRDPTEHEAVAAVVANDAGGDDDDVAPRNENHEDNEDDATPRNEDHDDNNNNNNNNNNTYNNDDEGDDGDDGAAAKRKKAARPRPRRVASDYRRVDFHWMVRDRNHLLWFSDLLNAVSRSQAWHQAHEDDNDDDVAPRGLDINIHTHVTQKRRGVATHVYRWLLEQHRTPAHPASPLTGLLNATQFGRPDFVAILDRHYDDTARFRAEKAAAAAAAAANKDDDANDNNYHNNNTNRNISNDGYRDGGRHDYADHDPDAAFRVGVFFCGTPIVGEILADHCRQLTTRGRADGTRLEYHFMTEVFA